MIIQLRGTSGSGKTTAMRRIMYQLGDWEPKNILLGRRKPTHYLLSDNPDNLKVAVLGHYESPCGGCDTFKNYGQLQAVVKGAHEQADVVLMEGLMLSDDVLQTVRMHEEVSEVTALYFYLGIDICIERVKARRAEKGRDEVFNEEKLRNRQEQIDRTRPRLEEAGIRCRSCSPDQSVRIVLGRLRLHAQAGG